LGGGGGGGTGASATADGRVPLLCCGAADVDALQTHWERAPQSWRDSVAVGCRCQPCPERMQRLTRQEA
jgi:hypothetical protein